MAELKQAEKLAKVRAEALSTIQIPEDAVQIGTATFLMATETGVAEIKVTARKGEVILEDEAEAYAEEMRLKQEAADARKAKAEAKKAADIARKAKAKAEKEAKEAES